MTFDATPKPICAPESEDGPPRFASLGGQTIAQFGLALSPANLSATQARDLGLLTSGIYGPRASTLSRNADLSASLASKLQAVMDSNGGGLFKMTWKQRNISPQRSIYALRASPLRISGNGYSGWPTATALDSKGAPSRPYRERGGGKKGMRLDAAVNDWCASWGTPVVNYANGTPEAFLERKRRSPTPMGVSLTDLNLQVQAFTGWPTPATDSFRSRSGERKDEMGLQQLAQSMVTAGPARLTNRGCLLTGYTAQTISGGQLHPDHPRWLMGYPEAWARAAPGWADWSTWQGLINIASSEPVATEPGH